MAVTEILRLMHPQRYLPGKRRFASVAFKNSACGGVSVIDVECIDDREVGPCEHIREFYDERVCGQPPVFWRIPVDTLPDGCSLEQQTTETGDHCHHNIVGITDKQCREILKSVPVTDYEVCDEDGHRSVTHEELVEAQAA